MYILDLTNRLVIVDKKSIKINTPQYILFNKVNNESLLNKIRLFYNRLGYKNLNIIC